MRNTVLTLLVTVALAVAGCADTGDQDQAEPTGTPTAPAASTSSPGSVPPTAEPTSGGTETGADLALTTCQRDDFTIGYSEDWWTNPGDEAPTCRFFHPEETEIQAESFHYAVQVYVDEVEYERVTGEDANEDDEILSQEETTVDGQQALVTEARSSGRAMQPEDTLRYSYVVDLDGRILVAATYSIGDTDYERDKAVLDRMVETLELPGTGA